MKRFFVRYFYFAVIACLAASFGACGVLRQQSVPPEEALRKRVAAYWETLIEDDLEEAFMFLEPNGRKKRSLTRFIHGMSNFNFLSYKIEDIKLEGDRALVRVKRTFRLHLAWIPLEMKPVSQTITDAWVRVNGIWYEAYVRPILPFPLNSKRSNAVPSLRQQ